MVTGLNFGGNGWCSVTYRRRGLFLIYFGISYIYFFMVCYSIFQFVGAHLHLIC